MSARTAAATPGVLDLDRDVAAVVQLRAIDLADRGGRDRLVVELGEGVLERLLELGLDHLAHVAEADLGRGVAQRAELALELLAVLLGHEPDVEEAHHLPELHRRALHRPERGHDLLGGLEVAALERGALALLGPGQVGRVRAELARRLAGGEARHAGGPRDPPGRDPVLGHPLGRTRRGGCGLGRRRGRRRRSLALSDRRGRRRRDGRRGRRRRLLGRRRRRASPSRPRWPSASASPPRRRWWSARAACRRTGRSGGRSRRSGCRTSPARTRSRRSLR